MSRSRVTGHVRKRRNSWAVVVIRPAGEDGPRRQEWISGTQYQGEPWDTEDEAHGALIEILDRIAKQTYVPPVKQGVAAYLTRWLDGQRSQLRPSTWESYRWAVEDYIIPALGKMPLQQLRASNITAFYATLYSKPGKSGRALAHKSIAFAHRVLHKALQDAVDNEPPELAKNPADRARLPRPTEPRRERQVWSLEEARTFLGSVRGDRLEAFWTLALTTGARRGELLALRWNNLSLDPDLLTIERAFVSVRNTVRAMEPKTARGRRTIDLFPEAVTALRAHRKRQLEERMAWGDTYHDDGLIFANEDGTPLMPDRVSKTFNRLVKWAGVRPISFHDMRHSHASWWLESGENIAVLSHRLGHATAAFTLNIYTHTTDATRQRATEEASKYFGSVQQDEAKDFPPPGP